MGGCDTLKNVFVYERTPTACNMVAGRDKTFDEVLQGPEHRVRAVRPSAPSTRCSSCTPPAPPASPRACSTPPAATCCGPSSPWTGRSTSSPTDVFWCTADIGWITGHTYVAYGPLAAGATQVIFEGVPTYPNAGRFWQMIESHKVTIFYTAPTAIRSLIKAAEGDEKVHPARSDLSSLRILGSVGEPINPEAWMWYYRTWAASVAPSWTPSGRPKPAAT
jgi:acetyl-CoA synthetase